MDNRRPDVISVNGELKPYDEATVHVLSAALKYGIVAFEGLRGYWDELEGEVNLFRAREHFERLRRSVASMRIDAELDVNDLVEDLVAVTRANFIRGDMHARTQVIVTSVDGRMGSTGPVQVVNAAIPMDRFFGHDNGVHVAVSSWDRISDRSIPPRIKAIANYHNSRLALLQAKIDGYDDTVMLNGDGLVAEGSGYNIFIVRRGVLATPRITDGVLEGITRETLLTLASELGLPAEERAIDRTELYMSDEAFFCGSAAEITPIFSVDRHPVGNGTVGDLTAQLREEYGRVVHGREQRHRSWLLPVYGEREPAA